MDTGTITQRLHRRQKQFPVGARVQLNEKGRYAYGQPKSGTSLGVSYKLDVASTPIFVIRVKVDRRTMVWMVSHCELESEETHA